MFRHTFCLGFLLAISISSVTEAQNLVTNGKFETPIVIGTYADLYDAGQSFEGWTVSVGRVGLVHDRADPSHSLTIAPYEGRQFVQLAGIGGSNGGLYQDLTTAVGKTYTLSFGFTGNPDTNYSNPIKQMQLKWGGAIVDTLSLIPDGRRRPIILPQLLRRRALSF